MRIRVQFGITKEITIITLSKENKFTITSLRTKIISPKRRVSKMIFNLVEKAETRVDRWELLTKSKFANPANFKTSSKFTMNPLSIPIRAPT